MNAHPQCGLALASNLVISSSVISTAFILEVSSFFVLFCCSLPGEIPTNVTSFHHDV